MADEHVVRPLGLDALRRLPPPAALRHLCRRPQTSVTGGSLRGSHRTRRRHRRENRLPLRGEPRSTLAIPRAPSTATRRRREGRDGASSFRCPLGGVVRRVDLLHDLQRLAEAQARAVDEAPRVAPRSRWDHARPRLHDSESRDAMSCAAGAECVSAFRRRWRDTFLPRRVSRARPSVMPPEASRKARPALRATTPPVLSRCPCCRAGRCPTPSARSLVEQADSRRVHLRPSMRLVCAAHARGRALSLR